MQTLYSSTFLSAILAFLIMLGQTGQPIVLDQSAPTPSFRSIIEPVGPTLASPDGKVQIEVFNTFDCPECDSFGLSTLFDLREKYTEDERVEFYLYLIPDKTSEAELFATRGVHCSSKYDRFWDMVYEMHNKDVINQREVDITGQGMSFPVLEFRDCISGEEMVPKIEEDLAYAQTRGITRKPSILVNGTLLLGAQPLENIERAVNQHLSY
ncbi:MAG: DsbA family protein [Candidatus Peregrinibacteria bacterium]|nr:DsbA family protein [Candidatus Peregrinibacteria bacterium]